MWLIALPSRRHLLTDPLQVVKNRLQAINSETHSDMQYSGVLDAVRRMVQAEGYGSFFKGLKTKMLQVGGNRAPARRNTLTATCGCSSLAPWLVQRGC